MSFEQAEMIDLSVYEKSSIWDIVDAPASLVSLSTFYRIIFLYII